MGKVRAEWCCSMSLLNHLRSISLVNKPSLIWVQSIYGLAINFGGTSDYQEVSQIQRLRTQEGMS